MAISVHSSLRELAEKVEAGAVWTREDALQLLASFDLIDIGRLAEEARRRQSGDATSFVVAESLRLEELGALADRAQEAEARGAGLILLREPRTWSEPYSAYLEAIRSTAARLGEGTTLALANTALAESLARLAARDVPAALTDLWTAGIRLIAGGEELTVHKAAHQVGIRSVVDLPAEAPSAEAFVDAVLAVRALQEETGGFVAARLALPARLSGVPDAKQIACARLLLHNIHHLSLGWNALIMKAAQVLMHFGVDDLGPVQEQKADLKEMAYQIRQTGRQPVLRNGLFEPIRDL
jgi:aminodeoxyfutalosine synthase